jgi:hypothetical protein
MLPLFYFFNGLPHFAQFGPTAACTVPHFGQVTFSDAPHTSQFSPKKVGFPHTGQVAWSDIPQWGHTV